MKNNRRHLLMLVAVLVLQTGEGSAQPDLPPTDGGPGCCPDPPDGGGDPPGDPDPAAIPFDGGLSLLLAAGAAYGMHRTGRRRNPSPKG